MFEFLGLTYRVRSPLDQIDGPCPQQRVNRSMPFSGATHLQPPAIDTVRCESQQAFKELKERWVYDFKTYTQLAHCDLRVREDWHSLCRRRSAVMKLLAMVAVTVSVLAAPVVVFAQQDQQDGSIVTRAQVKAELARVVKAGYNPSAQDENYPTDMLAAEARAAEQAAGQSGAGPASQSN
jgi:hypothetical protein